MSDASPAPLSQHSYNVYSRWLHWIIAALIIFMIFLGWRLDDHDSLRLSRVNLHKSVGILILLLSVVRLAIRFMTKAPPEQAGPVWQSWAAKGLHVLFYVAMLGMPLTGWAMVSTSAREIPFFMFHWPHMPFVPISADMENPVHEFFELFHKLGAKLLIYGMIPLHVAAALKHQFVDKDEVLEHMVPGLKPRPIVNWRWIVPVGVVVLAVGFGEFVFRGKPSNDKPLPPVEQSVEASDMADSAMASSSASVSASVSSSASSSASASVAAVTQWTVDKAASKIGWSTTFQGEAINGGFGGYTAQIAFDPDKLDQSHVKVGIDLGSVASGDNDRDGTLKSDQFFNVPSFPKAVYEASKFTKTDATHFVAHGKLTLHGVTKALDLPFSLTIRKDVADMSGTADLDRTAFSVGSGDYEKTDAIPAVVKVAITLKAHATKAAK